MSTYVGCVCVSIYIYIHISRYSSIILTYNLNKIASSDMELTYKSYKIYCISTRYTSSKPVPLKSYKYNFIDMGAKRAHTGE